MNDEAFYVVAKERGQERADLPTWADRRPGNIEFEPQAQGNTSRREIPEVPGSFQLFNVLTDHECDQFVHITNQLGYHLDAPVSLPHSIRHNTNLNWIVDESIDGPIWSRCSGLIPEQVMGHSALGLNARFRFYRYAGGDYFKPHTDGAWPGSRVIDNTLVHDAYGDRSSQMSMLLFLSDGYSGGRTLFYVPSTEHPNETDVIAIATPKAAALCFPHGFHPLHCLHAGEPVSDGVKYIIRTDVLFG